jgi:hypothetical protein
MEEKLQKDAPLLLCMGEPMAEYNQQRGKAREQVFLPILAATLLAMAC